MGLKLVTAPQSEPLSLADAKLHLRRDDTDTSEDSWITGAISAARRRVEAFLARPLLATGYIWTLDYFPGCYGYLPGWFVPFVNAQNFDRDERIIRFPIGGLIAVTAINYLDTTGAMQLLDPSVYRVDSVEQPARLAAAYNQVWPNTQPELAAISIAFNAGYGTDASAVPLEIIQAMKLILGHFDRNREDSVLGMTTMELPKGAEHLLWPERVFGVRRG